MAGPRAGGTAANSAKDRTSWTAPVILVGAALAAIAIVNPFRNFLAEDDGWAYARSVEHLLQTGQYRLDSWSAANMPVQIYFAAGLAKIFGYSLSLLSLSTLALLLLGLSAFLALLRELGLNLRSAAILTLGLLASPLVLMLTFTFMSDIQFMSWMVLALWLYVRGISRGNDGTIFLGSIAAVLAIGTRQFGMAILGGVSIALLLPRTGKSARRFVCATALPLAASLWQLHAGFFEPTFTQVMRLHEQSYFLSLPNLAIAHELGWRLSVIMQYVALSMLPVFPLLATVAFRRVVTHHKGELLSLFLVGGLMAVSLTTSPISMRPNAGRVLLLSWMLPNAFWVHPVIMGALTLGGVVGAFPLSMLVWRFLSRSHRWRDLSPGWVLVGSTGGWLLLLHLTYVQLYDTYIVDLLPFALLVLAHAMRRIEPQLAALHASAVMSLLMVVLLSFWMRGNYNRQEAQWAAADKLVAERVPARCIGAPLHWAEYHGAFDDWLAVTHPTFNHSRGYPWTTPLGHLHDPFYKWVEERSRLGLFQIFSGSGKNAQAGWNVIRETPYRNPLFQQKTIATVERVGQKAQDGKACREGQSHTVNEGRH
jgi:hypothetical protein